MKINLFGLFLNVVESISLRPFEFLAPEQKNKLVDDFVAAVLAWEQIFERNSIDDPDLQLIIQGMKDCLTPHGFDEIRALDLIRRFINNRNCLSLRQSAGNDFDWPAFDEKMTGAIAFVGLYHHSIDILKNRGKKMTEEEKKVADLALLKKIGVFYILEYTIFLLKEIPNLTKEQREDLFYRGITIGNNKMMPYEFYAESFYNELCLKIYNDELRQKLFIIFFDFKEIFARKDISAICLGFKDFNLELIEEFRNFGLVDFKTIFLDVFDKKDVTMNEVYEYVNNLKID